MKCKQGADSFFDKTSGNSGDHYRDGDLDIGELNDNSGWFVGWTETGEWLEYQEVELGCGTYLPLIILSKAEKYLLTSIIDHHRKCV